MRIPLMITLMLALTACATAPTGLEAGRFVSFTCEGGAMQARWNPDGDTVRVRSQHGAVELSRGEAAGTYSGDGFTLTTKDGIALSQGGKTIAKDCRKA